LYYDSAHERLFQVVSTRSPKVDNSTDAQTQWPIEYWDSHSHCPLFKVNSHQLDESDTKMKTNPRYQNLTPKLLTLNANHWTDISAGLPQLFHPNHMDCIEALTIPRLAQRLFLTWGGMSVDKNVASRFRKTFVNEKTEAPTEQTHARSSMALDA